MDISVIILTYNEELHIRRAIENVKDIATEIFIIDSYSTDRTLDIAREYPMVTILQNKWENNYAKQLNWGLNNAPIKTKWVLRLDADEYLTSDLKDEIKNKLSTLAQDVTGISFKRRTMFMGKWMKKGIYPVILLRLFQRGKAICEQRLMDEHIQLLEGKETVFENDFVDDNLNDISWYCQKHINYAVREAGDLLDIEYNITGAAQTDRDKHITAQAIEKRDLKHKYARKPLFLRSFLYFLYRYLYRGAIFEGKEGFLFSFIQGWWYRTLVDFKIYELKKLSGGDVTKIKQILESKYHVNLFTDNDTVKERGINTPPHAQVIDILAFSKWRVSEWRRCA